MDARARGTGAGAALGEQAAAVELARGTTRLTLLHDGWSARHPRCTFVPGIVRPTTMERTHTAKSILGMIRESTRGAW